MLQVVARDVLPQRATELDDLSRRHDDLEPCHPCAGDAVLERVRTARIRRDVAADLRLLGRAWIGREEQTALARDAAQLRGAHTRVDLDAPEQWVEGAHAVESFERDHDAAVERHRAAGVAGSPAARDDRNAVRVAPRDDLGDLLR